MATASRPLDSYFARLRNALEYCVSEELIELEDDGRTTSQWLQAIHVQDRDRLARIETP